MSQEAKLLCGTVNLFLCRTDQASGLI